MNRHVDDYPVMDTTATQTYDRSWVQVADAIGASEHSRLQTMMYPYAPSATLNNEMADRVFTHETNVINDLIDQKLGATTEPNMLDFIRRNIETRMLLRYGTNKSAYSVGLRRNSPVSPEGVSSDDHEAARVAVESGYATMAQADMVRQSHGMGSMEYGSLTVIGDERVEHLDDMYAEASQLVGHDIKAIKPYRTEVVGFDREPDSAHTQHMGAVRITLRRHLGQLPDGAELKQRSVIVIDLRPRTGINPEIYSAIFAAYEREKTSKQEVKLARKVLKAVIERSSDEVVANSLRSKSLVYIPEPVEVDYAKLPEIQDLIEWLVEQDMNHPVVLARNETIYASHPEVDAKIRTEQYKRPYLTS